MAAANDYVISEERCRLHADQASREEVKQVWLTLAESYAALLVLDKMRDSGAMIGARRLK